MNNFFNKYASVIKENSIINEAKYQNYNIKKGLRNNDGTGVIVGITKVGAVLGYKKENDVKIPVDGRLFFRNYELIKLLDEIKNEDHLFEKINYLLLFSKLPSKDQLKEFKSMIFQDQILAPDFVNNFIFNTPSPNMMNQLQRSVLDLYISDNNPDEISEENLLRQAIRIIAKVPIMLLYSYLVSNFKYENKGLVLKDAKEEYSLAQNILYLLREDGKFSKLEADLLDIMLVIHADHGAGNNSTFTTRVISSTQTDTYSAISAAIGSLKGPKHGGANAKVRAMINDIKSHVNIDDKQEVNEYLRKIINKETFDKQGLVYGMGHAIYTKSDPRAIIIKDYAYKLALEKGLMSEYNLYESIEADTAEIFKEIKGNDFVICANVDLYSGFVYEMLNIPFELYTPLFAIARLSAWNAHRLEQIFSDKKIIRPAYISIDNEGNIIK